MFNPEEYRKNREEGIRGQGNDRVPLQPLNPFNRAYRRRKLVNRKLTTKTARIKSEKEQNEIIARVLKTEQGEKQRIEKKKAEQKA